MSAQGGGFVNEGRGDVSSQASSGASVDSGSSSPQRRVVEPDRPADQHEWTEDVLRRLARDREHMQNVRDLYMISNPEEFQNIFVDPNEEGEERIPPANLLVGNADAEFYGEPYVDTQTRSTPGEIIEMHQSRNYNDEDQRYPWYVDPNDPSLVYEFDSDDDAERDAAMGRLERAEAEWTSRVYRRELDDQSDDEQDRRPEWNRAEYATMAEAWWAEIGLTYWALPEHQRQAYYDFVDQTAAASMFNDNQPRWMQELASDLVDLLAADTDARDEVEEEREWQNRRVRMLEQVFQERRELEHELEHVAPEALAQLRQQFQTIAERFAEEESEMWADFCQFRDAANRTGQTMTRRSDIYTRFPWLPQDLRTCLEDLANHHRKEACIRQRITYCEAYRDGWEFVPDPMNEEDWAGVNPFEGRGFGYEIDRPTNGFAHFIAPDMGMPVDQILDQIRTGHFLRMGRLVTARIRLSGEEYNSHPSDSLVVGQYLSWQHEARKYLAELAELVLETVEQPQEYGQAILRGIKEMEDAETQVYQEWQMNAERAEEQPLGLTN